MTWWTTLVRNDVVVVVPNDICSIHKSPKRTIMTKKTSLAQSLSNQETVWGMVYVCFQLVLLSSLLLWGNRQLGSPLSTAELNFVYYLINFLATLLIYHDFLGKNLRQATQHPAYFCQAVILGFVAYQAASWAVTTGVRLLRPGFTNYNDASLANMASASRFLVGIGTVILVPMAEECLFRGLIFRNLYGKSHWAAYCLSILAFAAIHILGYIGKYAPVELLIAVLQYLPAGLCLAWTYVKSGSIFAPMVVHGAINYLALRAMR